MSYVTGGIRIQRVEDVFVFGTRILIGNRQIDYEGLVFGNCELGQPRVGDHGGIVLITDRHVQVLDDCSSDDPQLHLVYVV